MILDDIEKMMNTINSRVKSFTQRYRPRYIKNSKWVNYNKNRFDMDKYIKASPSRRDIIERDLLRNIERMPTAVELKDRKDVFIQNFNEALEAAGLEPAINNRNYLEFSDFVERYDNIVTETKYRDSGQIAQLYTDYIEVKQKYDSIDTFFTDLLEKENKN